MASSSSYDHNKSYQYDVFLSFSGEDTRKTFIDHLYVALDQQGICTFKDDERLAKGKKINDELLQSIKDSRLYIIVFSKRYASSSWCLNELLKIMECHKRDEHTAFPVFYDVDPSEVRKQSGLVGEALATHKNKSESEIKKWRDALQEAANLSGWDVRKTADGHEAKVIKLIVERISLELRSINMGIDDNLVGMEQRMQDLDPYLDIGSNDVRMIGIKGMGGAGKTTLARTIFDKISFHFEGKSFVENVRERAPRLFDLKELQQQVLRNVCINDNITVSGVHEGKNLMKNTLCGKKVLVILDDVDSINQLEMLAGDTTWFGAGSRIIITTRDEQVLKAHGVKYIHDVNILKKEEAIRLFSRHAFGKDIPSQEYVKHSLEVVSYAAGLPLTIKVLGSNLCGIDASDWAGVLERLKRIPEKETLKILKLSYESLDDDQKEIFLDVACFLRNWNKKEAIRMSESCGFSAKDGLRVLEQKSLISMSKDSDGQPRIMMHDLLVEMGKNIVRGEHADEPNKHSRLWVQEEIEYVLASDLVNEATRYIHLEITPRIDMKRLENMKTLRCLIVNTNTHVKIDEARIYFPNSLRYLYWHSYPHWHLPKTFEANNLVGLEMHWSKIEQLWEEGKVMKNLKFLNLSRSKKLRSLDLGMTPNLEWLDLSCSKLRSLDLGMTPNLEWLDLEHCYDLVEVCVDEGKVMKKLKFLGLSWSKIRSLDLGMTPNLESLDLSDCVFLEEVYVDGGCLKSLIYLKLSFCERLKWRFFIKQFESLEVIDMRGLNTMELMDHIFTGHSNNSLLELVLAHPGCIKVPSSIENLHKLVSLTITCVQSLPGSICTLRHLRTLDLQCSHQLEELPEDLDQLECLETLDLSHSYFESLPRNICMLKRLKTLLLRGCKSLEKLPEDIGQLESLEILHLSLCLNLREIPNNICKLKRLKELELEGCKRLEKVVEGVGDLECLELLNIKDSGITHLPPNIHLLKGLKIYTTDTSRERDAEQ